MSLLDNITPEQQLQLVFMQDTKGYAALHYAAHEGRTETVMRLLDNLTPEQQLKLLTTQNNSGDTALHEAAQKGATERVKTMLANLTPEQQLKLLSVQNKKGMTAYEGAVGHYMTSDTLRTLEHYQKEADYRVNYRKFAKFT